MPVGLPRRSLLNHPHATVHEIESRKREGEHYFHHFLHKMLLLKDLPALQYPLIGLLWMKPASGCRDPRVGTAPSVAKGGTAEIEGAWTGKKRLAQFNPHMAAPNRTG
jgi:hypothetical protein